MSDKKGSVVSFLMGSFVGACAGVAAGVLLAPRSGEETRAMAADKIGDAWDYAVDAYESGSATVCKNINNTAEAINDGAVDELRKKVQLARERMSQIRSSLTESIDMDAIHDATAPTKEAQAVKVEVVEKETSEEKTADNA